MSTSQSKADAAIRVTKANASAIAKRLHKLLSTEHAWKGTYMQAFVLAAKSLGWRSQEAMVANYLAANTPAEMPKPDLRTAADTYRELAYQLLRSIVEEVAHELVAAGTPKATPDELFSHDKLGNISAIREKLAERFEGDMDTIEAIRFVSDEWNEAVDELIEQVAAQAVIDAAMTRSEDIWYAGGIGPVAKPETSWSEVKRIRDIYEFVNELRDQIRSQLAKAPSVDAMEAADLAGVMSTLVSGAGRIMTFYCNRLFPGLKFSDAVYDDEYGDSALIKASNFIKEVLDLEPEAIRIVRMTTKNWYGSVATTARDVASYSVTQEALTEEFKKESDVIVRTRFQHRELSDADLEKIAGITGPRVKDNSVRNDMAPALPDKTGADESSEISKILDNLNEAIKDQTAKRSVTGMVTVLVYAAEEMLKTYCAALHPGVNPKISMFAYHGENPEDNPFSKTLMALLPHFRADDWLVTLVKARSKDWDSSFEGDTSFADDDAYKAAYAVVSAAYHRIPGRQHSSGLR